MKILIKTLTFVFLLVPFTLEANQQILKGEWHGELKVNSQVTLPLVVRFENHAGAWAGELDTPSQGGFGIKMTSVSVDGAELVFEIVPMGIKYTGTYNQETKKLEGNFFQGQNFQLNFSRATPVEIASNVTQTDLVGSWSGPLKTPGGELVFVVHFKLDGNKLTGSADSPSQGATGMRVTNIKLDGAAISISMPDVGASFSGQLTKDKSAIVGTFKQGGAELPLTLDQKPAEQKMSARPQTPTPPFDYQIEEVSFENQAASITLAGTLTKPKGKIKATAIMITGSGPQDRDETILRHKPFAVIADYLTSKGYAVLRFDDRGVGKSTGDFSKATTEDFVTDVESAFRYLESRNDIPSKSIGLIGHSEGGMVAAMHAAENKDVAFSVLLAGPGVPSLDLYLKQRQDIFAANGLSTETLAAIAKLDKDTFKQIIDLPKGAEATDSIRANLKELLNTHLMVEDNLDAQIENLAKTFTSPWFKYFLSWQPRPYFTKIQSPVLAINGALDLQVSPKENLNGIDTLLEKAGNKDYQVVELEQLNHLFQTATTGAPSEYDSIEETFSPKALKVMSDWLNNRF